jgi:FkbM family methyltransferase
MIKNLLRKLLPSSCWGFLRYWRIRILNQSYASFLDLDRKLEKYISYENGFFVELGANDGFTQSNTLHLEIYKNWRGVLIEPSPHLFLSCVDFRSRDGNSIFCNACVPFDFQEKYVDIEYANLMSVSTNLGSDLEDMNAFISDTAKPHLRQFERDLKFGAAPKTLTSILDASKAPREIDLLSLDVEGAELEVLKGVDFSAYSFKYMLIECRDLERMSSFLEPLGYVCIDQFSVHDYLFSKKQ